MKTDQHIRLLRYLCLFMTLRTVGCAYVQKNDQFRFTLMPYAVECQVSDVPAVVDSIPLCISHQKYLR